MVLALAGRYPYPTKGKPEADPSKLEATAAWRHVFSKLSYN